MPVFMKLRAPQALRRHIGNSLTKMGRSGVVSDIAVLRPQWRFGTPETDRCYAMATDFARRISVQITQLSSEKRPHLTQNVSLFVPP
jgi:hypothetical protein